jgi:hypothetical protein
MMATSPLYRCLFLDKDGQVVRIDEFVSYDDDEARREAMFFLAKSGRFAGYELWRDSRKVDEFKFASPPEPRTSEWRPSSAGSRPPTNSPIAIFCGTTSHGTGGTRSGTLGSPNWRSGSMPLAAPAHATLPPILPGR